MGSRDEILARVGSALADVEPIPAPDRVYGVKVPPSDIPDLPGLFVERVADYRAVVARVTPDQVPAALAVAVAPAARVVVPAGLPGEWLGALEDVDLVADDGASADELDRIDAVVTTATIGIAMTGTIVLDHGPGQGRRALSLVPDLHVCLIRESQLVGDVPEAVARVKAAVAAGRPLTWVSGPSATSDIELQRVEGVHGPRRLHVLLIQS